MGKLIAEHTRRRARRRACLGRHVTGGHFALDVRASQGLGFPGRGKTPPGTPPRAVGAPLRAAGAPQARQGGRPRTSHRSHGIMRARETQPFAHGWTPCNHCAPQIWTQISHNSAPTPHAHDRLVVLRGRARSPLACRAPSNFVLSLPRKTSRRCEVCTMRRTEQTICVVGKSLGREFRSRVVRS